MDGHTLGIRTSAIEEKCQAFETLVIYCSTLGPRFAPYLAQCLELTLPSLKFYFHDGVREACAMYVNREKKKNLAITPEKTDDPFFPHRLIPMLLSSGKTSGTLTNQMVSATFHQLINCLKSEHDSSFLASLYKCFADSVSVIGGTGALPSEFFDGVTEATSRQLQTFAEKRKARAGRQPTELDNDKEDMALLEEIEDFALEDMAKMLTELDPNHPLLVAVSSVKGLGSNRWDSDEDDEES